MQTALVTTLKRKATDIIKDLNKKKEPVLITQYGKPAAYLLDPNYYQALLARLTVYEKIAVGEKQIREGKTFSQQQVEERLSKWLK